MAKCKVWTTITVPVEVEIEVDNASVERHGSTFNAIVAVSEDIINNHVIFSDMFGRGQVRAVENVRVDNWSFE